MLVLRQELLKYILGQQIIFFPYQNSRVIIITIKHSSAIFPFLNFKLFFTILNTSKYHTTNYTESDWHEYLRMELLVKIYGMLKCGNLISIFIWIPQQTFYTQYNLTTFFSLYLAKGDISMSFSSIFQWLERDHGLSLLAKKTLSDLQFTYEYNIMT